MDLTVNQIVYFLHQGRTVGQSPSVTLAYMSPFSVFLSSVRAMHSQREQKIVGSQGWAGVEKSDNTVICAAHPLTPNLNLIQQKFMS